MPSLLKTFKILRGRKSLHFTLSLKNHIARSVLLLTCLCLRLRRLLERALRSPPCERMLSPSASVSVSSEDCCCCWWAMSSSSAEPLLQMLRLVRKEACATCYVSPRSSDPLASNKTFSRKVCVYVYAYKLNVLSCANGRETDYVIPREGSYKRLESVFT